MISQPSRKSFASDSYLQNRNEHPLTLLEILFHDLRGGLVSMSATVKLLCRGYYGRMDEPAEAQLQALSARMAGLIRLFEESLEKIMADRDDERGALDLKEDVIDPVLEEFSPDIRERHLKVDSRIDPAKAPQLSFKMNKVWLKTVFRNLLKNAIQYGDVGGTIAIGLENADSSSRLSVYNSGDPVPEGRRSRLFTKGFHRRTHGKRRSKGMGLGLYLIKKIIRKHGGDITYEAGEHGSNFNVDFPCGRVWAHSQPPLRRRGLVRVFVSEPAI